jgi:hypothetical protein
LYCNQPLLFVSDSTPSRARSGSGLPPLKLKAWLADHHLHLHRTRLASERAGFWLDSLNCLQDAAALFPFKPSPCRTTTCPAPGPDAALHCTALLGVLGMVACVGAKRLRASHQSPHPCRCCRLLIISACLYISCIVDRHRPARSHPPFGRHLLLLEDWRTGGAR